MKWHGGKGSERRPQQIPEKQLEENWRRIFGTTKPKKK